jgi:hypothetical protein
MNGVHAEGQPTTVWREEHTSGTTRGNIVWLHDMLWIMPPIGESGIGNARRAVWSDLDEDRMAEGQKVCAKRLRRRWAA